MTKTMLVRGSRLLLCGKIAAAILILVQLFHVYQSYYTSPDLLTATNTSTTTSTSKTRLPGLSIFRNIQSSIQQKNQDKSNGRIDSIPSEGVHRHSTAEELIQSATGWLAGGGEKDEVEVEREEEEEEGEGEEEEKKSDRKPITKNVGAGPEGGMVRKIKHHGFNGHTHELGGSAMNPHVGIDIVPIITTNNPETSSSGEGVEDSTETVAQDQLKLVEGEEGSKIGKKVDVLIDEETGEEMGKVIVVVEGEGIKTENGEETNHENGRTLLEELLADDSPSSPHPSLPSMTLPELEVEESANDPLNQPKNWTPEEQELVNWSWRQVAPHASLDKFILTLDDDEKRTRDWLRTSRPILLQGRGVGLGSRNRSSIENSGSTSPRQAAPGLLPPHSGFPQRDEGPGEYDSRGSWDKWTALLKEWQTGEVEGTTSCKAGIWGDEYKEMHQSMMAGSTKPRLIENYCPASEPCGGLADRLLGLATTFLYGLITKRAVAVHWDNPLPFDLLFDSPNQIDWSYPYLDSSEAVHPIYGNKGMIQKREVVYVMQWVREKLDTWFVGRKWTGLKSPWLRVLINRGLVIRSFSYKNVKTRIHALGLKSDTAFSCLINYLIRPKPRALTFINEYTSVFSLPTVFSIGIQIRTGDKSMKGPELDKINTVKRHRAYFRCAEQVAERYAHSSQKVIYYLISDSSHLKKDALQHYGDKVVVSGLGVRHTDPLLMIEGDGGEIDQMQGTMDSVVESWTFAGTDFKIITEQSGFGKIAAFLRAKPASTITIFPEFDEDIQEAWRREPGREHLDCGLDSALVPFSTLANQWSLG